jgi:hypothetical protein
MDITEIESALRLMPPEELDRVEGIVREIRRRKQDQAEEQLERANGFCSLPRRAAVLATSETVRSICDKEGI